MHRVIFTCVHEYCIIYSRHADYSDECVRNAQSTEMCTPQRVDKLMKMNIRSALVLLLRDRKSSAALP